MRAFIHICSLILVLAAGTAKADLPEPLIYLSYNDTWANQGTAGFGEEPNVFVTAYGITPKISSYPLFGVVGPALDYYSDVDYGIEDTNDVNGGYYAYGNLTPEDPCDDTAMQSALNGLTSFTMMFWYNSLDRKIPQHGTSWFYRAANEANSPPYGRGWLLRTNSEDPNVGRFQLCVDDVWSGISDPCYNDVNEWIFFAVTYDSSANWQENVKFYKGLYDTPGDVNTTGVSSLIDQYGVAPNTPELHTRISVFCDSTYETVAVGLFDEFRLFGSKTDSSGALTLEQIQAYHADAFTSYYPVCGDPNHPIPTADLNYDCVVNFKELAMLASEWLFGDRL